MERLCIQRRSCKWLSSVQNDMHFVSALRLHNELCNSLSNENQADAARRRRRSETRCLCCVTTRVIAMREELSLIFPFFSSSDCDCTCRVALSGDNDATAAVIATATACPLIAYCLYVIFNLTLFSSQRYYAHASSTSFAMTTTGCHWTKSMQACECIGCIWPRWKKNNNLHFVMKLTLLARWCELCCFW